MTEEEENKIIFMKGFNHAYILASENKIALNEIIDGMKGQGFYPVGFRKGLECHKKLNQSKGRGKGGMSF